MSLIVTALGTKIAIAALSLVVVGGGTAVAVATAAANGALPALPISVQTDATKGPDATGPAAFGLCTAYTAGGLHNTSAAHAALVSASQSAGSIGAYCAPILKAHGHGSSKSKAPTPDAPTAHGKSGAAHGKASGAHDH